MSDNGKVNILNSRLMKLVIVGHVDHGKSTLVGRLMSDTDSLPTGKLDFVKDICKRQGKEFEFAFLLDALEEEQEQGITIDTSQIFFNTQKRRYVIIDAPGHKEFLKRHGYILKLLGLTQVAVVINKMDLVNYDPEVYYKIKADYTNFLSSMGIEAREFIPVSAKLGINIAKTSEEISWYKGPSVLSMLDQFTEKQLPTHLPFRFPVQDVYKFDERRIISGRVESGTVNVGDQLVFSPSNKVGVIKTIEAWSVENQPIEAKASESIGFTLEEQIFVERGDVATLKSDLPFVSTTFDVNVFWMGKRHLEKGRTYTLKLTTQEVPCEIVEFKKVVDASTLETLEGQEFLAKNDVAEVTLRTVTPVTFDLFGSIPTTGRFVLVDEYDVCGGGIITTYTPSKSDRLRDEVRNRDFHWLKSDIKPEERAYRNGHQSTLILIVGESGVGKAKLAKYLERKLFELNFQSYLLDGRNVALGVSADIDSQQIKQEGEVVRRFGEVAKLFLDAGHVVISTSNVFNQEDHTDLRLLVEPCQVVEIFVTDVKETSENCDMQLSIVEAGKESEAANTIYDYLKKKKILTGHNYSI